MTPPTCCSHLPFPPTCCSRLPAVPLKDAAKTTRAAVGALCCLLCPVRPALLTIPLCSSAAAISCECHSTPPTHLLAPPTVCFRPLAAAILHLMLSWNTHVPMPTCCCHAAITAVNHVSRTPTHLLLQYMKNNCQWFLNHPTPPTCCCRTVAPLPQPLAAMRARPVPEPRPRQQAAGCAECGGAGVRVCEEGEGQQHNMQTAGKGGP